MLVALVLNRSLICATVPVIVTEEVPELVTTAPLLPGGHRQRALGDGQRHAHGAGAGVHVR